MAGPLIVLTEYAELPSRGEQPPPNRRAYVYDAGTNKYWAALDYHHSYSSRRLGSNWVTLDDSTIVVVGASPPVWTDGQVRRVALNGYTEAILFEHDAIRQMKVSPDSEQVAIAYGDPFGLAVLDIATGEGLLQIGGDPRLDPLWEIARESDEDTHGLVTLGDWSAASDSLGIAARDGSHDDRLSIPDRVAILNLDGDVRVLPEGRLLTPDLRYSLRPGEHVIPDSFGSGYVWKSVDVIDIDTDEVLWTVDVAQGQGIVPNRGGIRGVNPDQYACFEFGDVLPDHKYEDAREAATRAIYPWNGGPPDPGVTARILDLASGETRTLSESGWAELRDQDPLVSKACHFGGSWDRCLLLFEGRVVWEGEPDLIGLVDHDEPLQLRGLTLLEWARPTHRICPLLRRWPGRCSSTALRAPSPG